MRASTLAAVLAAGGMLVAVPGCGSSGPAQAQGHKAGSGRAVDVTLDDGSVHRTPAVSPAGKVTLSVHNAGTSPHELVVLRTGKPAGDLGHGMRVPERDSVGEAGDVRPGTTKKVALRLRRGHYALICNMPGHYQSGMHADLRVT